MRTLAIETATPACSIALFDGDNMIARDHREIGRGHAERLVPMIEALPDKGKADRILVSLGPGSFTGVRIGLATARALGFAWKAEVLGYPTMALVAARAGQPDPADVTVCMNGGHGEWFVQNFAADWSCDEVASLSPQEAQKACLYDMIAGNKAEELAAMFASEKFAVNILPDAWRTNRLPRHVFTTNLAPIYGRAPDAVPQAQRVPS